MFLVSLCFYPDSGSYLLLDFGCPITILTTWNGESKLGHERRILKRSSFWAEIHDLGYPALERLAITRVFLLRGELTRRDAELIARTTFADPVTDRWLLRTADCGLRTADSELEAFLPSWRVRPERNERQTGNPRVGVSTTSTSARPDATDSSAG